MLICYLEAFIDGVWDLLILFLRKNGLIVSENGFFVLFFLCFSDGECLLWKRT